MTRRSEGRTLGTCTPTWNTGGQERRQEAVTQLGSACGRGRRPSGSLAGTLVVRAGRDREQTWRVLAAASPPLDDGGDVKNHGLLRAETRGASSCSLPSTRGRGAPAALLQARGRASEGTVPARPARGERSGASPCPSPCGSGLSCVPSEVLADAGSGSTGQETSAFSLELLRFVSYRCQESVSLEVVKKVFLIIKTQKMFLGLPV